MAFLLRVELPDIPGSLGALATVLGEAGADIEAIEIVEHRADGRAIDDVLLELPAGVMPDTLITACHTLAGVTVHWISRYNAGVNLSMDLEAVESFTEDADHAMIRLVDAIPATFRTDWAIALLDREGTGTVLHASPTAPRIDVEIPEWLQLDKARTLEPAPAFASTVLTGARGRSREGDEYVVVAGRHGGPEFLASEVARIGHMVTLAASVQS